MKVRAFLRRLPTLDEQELGHKISSTLKAGDFHLFAEDFRDFVTDSQQPNGARFHLLSRCVDEGPAIWHLEVMREVLDGANRWDWHYYDSFEPASELTEFCMNSLYLRSPDRLPKALLIGHALARRDFDRMPAHAYEYICPHPDDFRAREGFIQNLTGGRYSENIADFLISTGSNDVKRRLFHFVDYADSDKEKFIVAEVIRILLAMGVESISDDMMKAMRRSHGGAPAKGVVQLLGSISDADLRKEVLIVLAEGFSNAYEYSVSRFVSCIMEYGQEGRNLIAQALANDKTLTVHHALLAIPILERSGWKPSNERERLLSICALKEWDKLEESMDIPEDIFMHLVQNEGAEALVPLRSMIEDRLQKLLERRDQHFEDYLEVANELGVRGLGAAIEGHFLGGTVYLSLRALTILSGLDYKPDIKAFFDHFVELSAESGRLHGAARLQAEEKFVAHQIFIRRHLALLSRDQLSEMSSKLVICFSHESQTHYDPSGPGFALYRSERQEVKLTEVEAGLKDAIKETV